MNQSIRERYFALLTRYVREPNEEYLVEAAELGRALVLANVPPEEVAEMHETAICRLADESPNATLVHTASRITAPLMEVLMGYGLAFRQQLEARKRAEEALQKAHDELETRVEQRTAELVTANTKLQEEIAERKRAEERERQLLADLAHVGRLKTMGEMASGIAHELNQPLGAIVMRAEVAAQKLRLSKRPSDEKLTEDLTWLADQGHRAGEIIRRMRRFVRHVEPERTTVRLSEVVDEVLPLIASELRHAAIRLTVDVPPSLPVVVADKIQIQQVLLNLIRNSIEAMAQTEPGARDLSIRAKSRGNLLEVAVSDAGCGISEAEPDELFGTFYSTKASGMGMGLAISRSIIEAHGGRIWAEPRATGIMPVPPGRGATFAFTLPTADDGLDSPKTPGYADMNQT